MSQAQLPDPEVEAQLTGSRRVQEVLPLVRLAHASPGDPLVARQTRAQRRARREAQAQSQGGGGGVTQRARQRQAQVRPGAQPTKSQTGSQRRERKSFVSESWAELKKVEWPGQTQVIQATVVVLIACIVVGAYLYFNDLIWKPVVQRLIGQ
jgi:preprotein translocase subunit SecE